jgi:hypothetical protein
MKNKEIHYSMEFEQEKVIEEKEISNGSPSLIELFIVLGMAIGLIAGGLKLFSNIHEDFIEKQEENKSLSNEIEQKVNNIYMERQSTNSYDQAYANNAFDEEYGVNTVQVINSTKLFFKKHYGHLEKTTKTYYGNEFLSKTRSSYKESEFKKLQFTKIGRGDCKKISNYILKSRFAEKIQKLQINGRILEIKDELEVKNNCHINRPAKITIIL